MNQKVATAGGGFNRRTWERAFTAVLVLIAIIAAIVLYIVFSRWCDWYSCSRDLVPSSWPSSAITVSLQRLNSYSNPNEVFDLPPTTTHERYLFYTPSTRALYVLVAAQQTGSFGSPSYGRPHLDIQIWNGAGLAFPGELTACQGPAPLDPSGTPNGGSEQTFGWYCPIAPPIAPGGSYQTPSYGPLAYRIFVTNKSSTQQLRYTYVTMCDQRFPRGGACPDPDVELTGPNRYNGYGPNGGGYPSSSGYSPSPSYGGSSYPGSSYGGGSYGPPGGSSYPSGGSGYPSGGSSYPSGGSSYPSGGSGYPSGGSGSGYPSSSGGSGYPSSSSSSYPPASTPGTTASSPPPSSTGSGGH